MMSESDYPVHEFKTHRRTITEVDIVNFVNLTAFHEPYFIDMEFLKDNMTGAHRNRFAPGPMIISYSMGLVSPILMNTFSAKRKNMLDRAMAETGPENVTLPSMVETR